MQYLVISYTTGAAPSPVGGTMGDEGDERQDDFDGWGSSGSIGTIGEAMVVDVEWRW